jgi:hypothetical protein
LFKRPCYAQSKFGSRYPLIGWKLCCRYVVSVKFNHSPLYSTTALSCFWIFFLFACGSLFYF